MPRAVINSPELYQGSPKQGKLRSISTARKFLSPSTISPPHDAGNPRSLIAFVDVTRSQGKLPSHLQSHHRLISDRADAKRKTFAQSLTGHDLASAKLRTRLSNIYHLALHSQLARACGSNPSAAISTVTVKHGQHPITAEPTQRLGKQPFSLCV